MRSQQRVQCWTWSTVTPLLPLLRELHLQGLRHGEVLFSHAANVVPIVMEELTITLRWSPQHSHINAFKGKGSTSMFSYDDYCIWCKSPILALKTRWKSTSSLARWVSRDRLEIYKRPQKVFLHSSRSHKNIWRLWPSLLKDYKNPADLATYLKSLIRQSRKVCGIFLVEIVLQFSEWW